MSTLKRACLPSGSPTGAEVGLFLIMWSIRVDPLCIGCRVLPDCCQIVPGESLHQKQVYTQDTYAYKKTLPTFTWLSNAGIHPSTSQTFTLSTLTSALKAGSGVTPALDCTGSTLNAVSYYFNLKGSIIDGSFAPISTFARLRRI